MARPLDPPSPGDPAESPITPAAVGLLAVNVAVFVLAERFGPTTEVKTLLHWGAAERYHVGLGEGWRLGTAMFLHVGIAHLIWNAYATIGWSRQVERALGSLAYVVVYLLGGVAAASASVLGHDVVSAGASGATFAITGAALVVRFRRAGSLGAMLAEPDAKRTLASIAIWFAIGIWLSIDDWAHAGGFAAGTLLALAMTGKERGARRALFAVFALGLLGSIGFALRPGWQPSVRDGEVMAYYATEYYAGDKLVKDYPRARKFATKACEASSANACALYGFMLAKGDGVAKDDAQAASYFRRGCDGKSPFGCAALGRVTMLGLGVPKDPVKANEAFSQACDLGQPDGCAGYGISLVQGTGVTPDRERGLDILEKACAAGSTVACKSRLDPDAPPAW